MVELDEGARAKAKKAETGTGPCVYVGETERTPEQRFAQHSAGGRTSSKIVRDHGVRLRPDLATRGPFLTRANGERAERELGDVLRKRGFVVFGGTGKGVAERLRERLTAATSQAPAGSG